MSLRLHGIKAMFFASFLFAQLACADDWTNIRGAVYYGREEEVVRLLDSGIDVNIQNSEGYTLLHVAAADGNLRMVQYLLARGADPNVRNMNHQTPYDVASGYAQVQKALKAKMAPPKDPFAAYLPPDQGNKRPPNLGAAPRPAPVAGANDSDTLKKAREAVWYNNIVELESYLDAGLDVNKSDDLARETLLHTAAWRDRIDIARMLISRGANAGAMDKDGKRPADYAQSDAMKKLLGPAGPKTPQKASDNQDDHCKKMWREATYLCGWGNYSCNISASVRYQECIERGTWY